MADRPGPSGPTERGAQGPSGPTERGAQGPSGPTERGAQGPSGPTERGAQGPVALAIGGGGTLGSFETGALRFLYDHVGISPSVICGSSVGSLISARLAMGDGPEGERAIDGLEALWRNLRDNADMWQPEPWFASLIADGAWLAELRGHMARDPGGGHGHVMVHVIATILRHRREAQATVDALRQALGASSLLNLDPVKELIDRELDSARVARSGVTLRIPVVALESGELRFVTETGAFVDRDGDPLDFEPVALGDAVRASSSVPLVFPPVRLGTEHYVDGGARELLPIRMATSCLRRLAGANPDGTRAAGHTYAISALPLDLPALDSFEHKGLLDVWRRTTGTIGPNETLHKDVDPPGGWGPDVTLILPELRVHDPLTVDPELIAVSIDYGFMRAADVVLGLGTEAGRSSAEITRTRVLRRETVGSVPGPFGPPRPAPADAAPRQSADELSAKLAELVAKRRAAGWPLAPNL